MFFRRTSSMLSFLVFLVVVVITILPRSHQSSDDRTAILTQRILDELLQLENVASEKVDCGSFNTEAANWIDALNPELRAWSAKLSYANWDYGTNLTDENAKRLEDMSAEMDIWLIPKIETGKTYLKRRKEICNETVVKLLNQLVNGHSVPLANNPETRKSMESLVNSMSQIYGTATVTKDNKTYRLDPEFQNIMAESRDADELEWAWLTWRNITGPVIKPKFQQLVSDMNEAAQDNGFLDVSETWTMADFGMTDIDSMVDDLYEQIRPFYEQLHAYVRRQLKVVYPQLVHDNQPIPAHLLGNMWSQEWLNIQDLVIPYPNATHLDVTNSMIKLGYTPKKMFEVANDFFTSLGLEPMTDDFWKYSVITRPTGNQQMVCHASAEEFYSETDFRIKMCTSVNENDFQTVHHEMGHIQYFMLYRHQPALFRDGANAAFHEAVGDTIALSVSTPTHLEAIGLAKSKSAETSINEYKQDINFLMRIALQKIAFIPFAYSLDKWRMKVFRGEILPKEYNAKWCEISERYQGIRPPVSRTEHDFDPGSKYHVPANVPYYRYFLSFIGQFQFHEALCQASNFRGRLHKCDIYKSTAAGDKLRAVLSQGRSKPWRDQMKDFTGTTDFSVDALLKYFRPLIVWLNHQNMNRSVGW